MKLLCIDTTKQQAILALDNDGVQSVKIIPETKRHSEALLYELESFLCDNKLNIQDIDVFGCNVGPGSFTGIRIGVATIKAFKFALNKPVVSDNYFNIVSDTVKDGYVALKNTNSAIYLSNIVNGKAGKIEVVDNDKIDDLVKSKLYVDSHEHLEELLSYKDISVIDNFAYIMLNHFVELANKNKFTSDTDFAPLYAQLSQAERSVKD